MSQIPVSAVVSSDGVVVWVFKIRLIMLSSWLAYHVKTEVPSTLTLRVEVKERTDDVKHSGSDHRQVISAPIFRTLPLLRHLRARNK